MAAMPQVGPCQCGLELVKFYSSGYWQTNGLLTTTEKCQTARPLGKRHVAKGLNQKKAFYGIKGKTVIMEHY
jgi:hypothetical protein